MEGTKKAVHTEKAPVLVVIESLDGQDVGRVCTLCTHGGHYRDQYLRRGQLQPLDGISAEVHVL